MSIKNTITELEISNFKSIKNIKIDCKRINVFIGKPNVGKSNVLEALALFCSYSYGQERFLEGLVRYEKVANLFFDQDRKNQISIKTDIGFSALRFHMNQINSYDFITTNNPVFFEEWTKIVGQNNSINDMKNALSQMHLDNNNIKSTYSVIQDGDGKQQHYYIDDFRSPVKKYHFKLLKKFHNHFPLFLSPPFGDNLFTILEGNSKIWEECASYFNDYKLDLLIDTETETIEVQKKIGRRVTKIPYSLAADTLQRFIFHLAAIESNKNSILLFEEPENHSFPPYVSLLADKIIESKDNQFFIATHSPYLLTPFLEKCSPDEISIFVAHYENYETKVRALTEAEIQNILETGIDLFFNIPAFQ